MSETAGLRESLLRAVRVRFRGDEPYYADLLAAIAAQQNPACLLAWLEKLATFTTPSLAAAVLGQRAMSCNGRSGPPPQGGMPQLGIDFFENQQKVKPEDLLPYGGQHIAWSWDGSRIVDSDPDWNALRQKVIDRGLDPSRVVYNYVDDPEALR